MKSSATAVEIECYENKTNTVNLKCCRNLTEVDKCNVLLEGKKNAVKMLQISDCEQTSNVNEFISSFKYLDRLVISISHWDNAVDRLVKIWCDSVFEASKSSKHFTHEFQSRPLPISSELHNEPPQSRIFHPLMHVNICKAMSSSNENSLHHIDTHIRDHFTIISIMSIFLSFLINNHWLSNFK